MRQLKSMSFVRVRLLQTQSEFFNPRLLVNFDDPMKLTSGLVWTAIFFVALCSGCNSDAAKEFPSVAPTISADVDESSATAAETEQVDFAQDILPILERGCFPCHGPEMNPLSMAGFRVDLREDAVGRGKIIPGDPDESLLIKRLTTKLDSKRMPPLKSDNPQLNAEQIELLKRWIKAGANYGTE